MKKSNYILVASTILLTFSLITFGARRYTRPLQTQPAQPTQPAQSILQAEQLSPSYFNPALISTVNIGLTGLRIVIPDIPPTMAGLGPSIERKLSDADPRLAVLLRNGAVAGVAPVPQITVYIARLMLTANRPPVFSVRTILSANIQIPSISGPAIFSDVDVWARADTIQAPNINAEVAAVTTLVNKHFDEFITDFIQANTPVEIPADVNRPNTDAAQLNITEPNTPALSGEYNYIASKSQLIFHKLDCPAAKSILVKNRVYYKTREEAIAAGKKPCSICKP